MLMVRNVVAILAVLICVQARAQDGPEGDEAFQRGVYASIEGPVRQEVAMQLAMLARNAGHQTPEQVVRATNIIKFIAYNRAAIYVSCIVEVQRDRRLGNYRMGDTLQRFTGLCLDDKMKHLQRFTQLIEFVGLFGADRIPDCEQRARLPELERVLQAYEFLEMENGRLYDFAEYNKCLMPGN
jgi:hypothetical protein